MQISQNGINLIKQFEGYRLLAYDDGTGIYTIGYGHTKDVKRGQSISQEQADIYLYTDLMQSEKYVNDLVKVKINQNQFDSLVSFTFNCGGGALGSSTLLKKLNNSDYLGASEELLKWCKDGNGNVMQGLLTRRKKEKELFNTSYAAFEFTIKNLQSLLNEYGFNDSDNKKIIVDGICGPKTLGALPLLKYGMINQLVKWVQGIIVIDADGVFGGDTYNEVRKFQYKNDLVADGIIGKFTWKKLCEVAM